MALTRRSFAVYALLGAVWALVVVWQAEEHFRMREAAKTDLSNRSKDIANTVSACIRGMRFRGTVLQERLEPVLEELVNGRSNELVKASELISITLLNAVGEPVASAGRPIDFGQQKEILQHGERWGQHSVTFVNPVDLGASLTSEGGTNPTVVLPPMRGFTNSFREGPREGARREPPPEERPGSDAPSGLAAHLPATNALAHPEREARSRDGDSRPRRPPWLRGMNEKDYQSLLEKRSLHGLVLALSTEPFQAAAARDLWLRLMILLLATISAIGSGLAWRNLTKSSELEIRLVRASELNTHLKEMNLAAAGLAHETRNPLNIIRGLAQMISKQPEAAPEMRQKSRQIVDEVDKVAAQLNEFINYSRPREVRRSALALGSVVNEVARALGYDLEEKQIQLQIQGEELTIEADEQLLRQALFNLLLNAIQAVESRGAIQIVAQKHTATEALLEVRDNGPGVPPDRRTEIFKP
ncbi:MAG TPA: histidine kinase dimerization/phospho-acceptor domain-containing protein, partial [Candidatus Sulfotelmatobacter sp.]|nr:histidine kinase dimerization/phospho-acceptor domain-containing protein [Candidatus Sulfotelmatobacter sp.]